MFCLEGAAGLKCTPAIFKSLKVSAEDSKPHERHPIDPNCVLDDCKVLWKDSYHNAYHKGQLTPPEEMEILLGKEMETESSCKNQICSRLEK